MTVPFENDTGNIVRKLARKSLKSEKRRNLSGGDRRCAGILSDLFFDCDGFVYPADREKSCGGYL